MKNEDVQRLVERISMQYFKRPFLHQARFNHRLRTTGGRYLLRSHDIELNYRQYEYYGEEELIRVIKHELCHYHLHLEGRGYMHKDAEFKALLKDVGGSRYCRATDVPDFKHLYICLSCAKQFKRRRRVNTAKYVCGFCKGNLRYSP
ncbi:SprT family protein [Shouchella shacheensis]|uniref:SprT family protein n=1 Tax=Shouchella shacheensis TaxID=1649580 RepID=UPI00073FCB9D|nr:SprT family protein [Shouchella shacheensis]